MTDLAKTVREMISSPQDLKTLRAEVSAVAMEMLGKAQGLKVWRIADSTGAYCIEFSSKDFPNPKGAAERYFDEHQDMCKAQGYTVQEATSLDWADEYLGEQARRLLQLCNLETKPSTPVTLTTFKPEEGDVVVVKVSPGGHATARELSEFMQAVKAATANAFPSNRALIVPVDVPGVTEIGLVKAPDVETTLSRLQEQAPTK